VRALILTLGSVYYSLTVWSHCCRCPGE